MAYRRKKYSRRFRRTRRIKRWGAIRRRRLIRTIKAVAKKVAEPKSLHKLFDKFNMNHNVVSVVPLNQASFMPGPGTADHQRIGDQINVTGWGLRMLIGQQADRPNVTFRWWVVKVPKGSAYSYANWFDAATNNVLLDTVNTDFVKVIKTGMWRPNEAGLSATGGKEYTFAQKLWIPYKRTLKFGPAHGATTHNDDDVYFLIAPYDAYGTLTTDIVGYCQMAIMFYYRDP